MAAKHKQQTKKRPKLASRDVSLSEWEQLVEDRELREGWLELARAVNLAQVAAEERSRMIGTPVSESLDLRGAVRVLDQHPLLVKYLDGVRERQDLHQDALTRLDREKGNPTGSTRADSQVGSWAGSGTDRNTPVGVNNAQMLRNFADGDEWLNAGLNFLCERVARADVAVLPADERKRYPKPVLKSLELLLDQPNELRDSWPMLMSEWTRDILTLGQGALTKNMTLDRKPAALYAEDASFIKIYPAWSGDPDEPRYLYAQGTFATAARKVPLRNDECIVPFFHPATYRYGFGPVQTLVDTIRADIKATEAAQHMVDFKPPPHLVHLQGWSAGKLKQLRSDYESEIAGRREMMFIGGDNPVQVYPLMLDSANQQWLPYQEYLVRKICAVLQITPQDLGITYEVNKATGGTQKEISDEKGYLTLLLLIEEYLNREILSDYAPKLPMNRTDLAALNLRIMFPEVSEAQRRMHYARDIEIATTALGKNMPAATLNQILMLRGEQPVPHGGNTFYVLTKDGPMPWLSYDDDYQMYYGPVGSQDPAGGVDESEDIPSDELAADDVDSTDDSGAQSEEQAVEQVVQSDQAIDSSGKGGSDSSAGGQAA